MINHFYKLTEDMYYLLENKEGRKVYRGIPRFDILDEIVNHNKGLFAHRIEMRKNGLPDTYFYLGRTEVKLPALMVHKDRIIKDTTDGRVGDLLTTHNGKTLPIAGKYCLRQSVHYVLRLPDGSFITCISYKKITPLPHSEYELKLLKDLFHNTLVRRD